MESSDLALFFDAKQPIPFYPEQLSFTRTREFHHETYDFNETAEFVARKRGLVVIYPQSTQLQLDVDSLPQLEEVRRRLGKMFYDGVVQVTEKPSASGKPGHVHITVTIQQEEPITEWQRIALQSVLGSDPMREFLNCMRALSGTEKPTRFFEKPQV